ncbi:hypothetical protein RN001_013852 [Aquatica leii]|uniref:Endothelin-converting enzyme 1 n=1 Tax=Aquatica leii TaxID=1421715 RepID=A0AAN7PS98_9COLE|nr:hypothetical protein RN001_013852 [Aquatica leii]
MLKQHKESDDLFSWINKSHSACNDFYGFACDPWMRTSTVPDNQPVWNKWEVTSNKLIDRLEQMLRNNINKSKSAYLHVAQNIYKACVNSTLEARYVNELKALIKSLNGWPIVTPRWRENGYDWEVVVAKIIRLLGIHPLFKIHVFVDLQNTSQYSLYLEPGELNLPQIIFNSVDTYATLLEAYEQWMYNTINYLYPNAKNKYKHDIKNIIKFEKELAKLLLHKNKFEKIYISDLTKDIPLNWKGVYERIFHNTSVPSSYNKKIVLRNRMYLKKLVELISSTKKNIVANYIIWSVVKSLSRDTTAYMKNLSFKMDNIVYGIKEDLPHSHECVKKVITYMDSYLIKDYTNTYIHPQTINSANLMLKSIKTQFVKTLKKNTWLDHETKNLAIEKIAAIRYIMVAPKWIENKSFDEEFQKVKILPNNHFLNIIQLRALKSKLEFESLHQKVVFKWTDSLFEVNAFYNVLQNTVFIPVGLLEPPFFNVSAPLAVNYGALGTLIGHEISHALDTSGRHADKNGNVVNWWSQTAANTYEEKVSCFHQQYHKHNASDDFMLGENIADNVGLKLSFNALWAVENTKVHKYRNLKRYADQIFFISYAQIWCEISNNKLINIGEHPPVRIRVQETLQNSKDFLNVFHCEKTNEIQCSLW